MAIIKSKITSKRQVTVPRDVCDSLGIEPGDEIEWVMTKSNIRVRRGGDGPRFDRWRGRFKDMKRADVDTLIREMRGG